jgi:hypothetical protein
MSLRLFTKPAKEKEIISSGKAKQKRSFSPGSRRRAITAQYDDIVLHETATDVGDLTVAMAMRSDEFAPLFSLLLVSTWCIGENLGIAALR